MECEEDILLEAANALLLFSSSPPPDLPPAATINLFKPHPLPPAAMPATSIENVLLSASFPSWGVRSRRSHHMGKLKRKKVEGPSPPTAEAATCGHRSPDTPLNLGAAFDPSSSGSDGLLCSSEIRPFKRLRTCKTYVPEYDAQLKLKRKQVDSPSPSTAVAATCGHRSPDTPLDLGAASNPSSIESDGFMCSSEIRPFKRLRTPRISVPEYEAHIKRKQVDGPSPSTAVAANCSHRSPHTPLDLGAASGSSTSRSGGFPYSSEIRGCGFRCNDGLKTGGRDDSRADLLFVVSGERGRAFAVG